MKWNLNTARVFIKAFATALVAGVFTPSAAKEGMWLPPTIKSREADMKAMGLQISADKLYNDEGTGLNNAVVLFGGGCTGEVISPKGLILTNHHCGYGTVQRLSSTANDYFASSFWAMNMKEEIPCPGLKVTFFRKMKNVSGEILGGLPDSLGPERRKEVIEGRMETLLKTYPENKTGDVMIRSYFHGNEYWAIFTETYRDIRLVGFPSNGVGAFGGDTDNWMWPRHNGDFAIFRVYAGADNKPADYNPANKPFETRHFFTINTGGYKEGDFTMVYGFPGVTQEYISSGELNHIYSIIDPVRIEARTAKLDVWNRRMEASRDVFIKYTSKRAGVANGWKKWQGELRGLKLNDVPGKKLAYEEEFQRWASMPGAPDYADGLLGRMDAAALAADSVIKASEYIRETVLGIELVQQGAVLDEMLQLFRAGKSSAAPGTDWERIRGSWSGFFKNYDRETDKELFTALMPLYFEKGGTWVPATYRKMYAEQGRNFGKWAGNVYGRSMAASEDRMQAFMNAATPADSNKITADPAWQLYDAVRRLREERITGELSAYHSRMGELNRQYMKCRMEKDRGRDLYPDANLTLRLTYGQIKGIDPEGPARYSWQTDIDQLMAKDNPESHEFRIPEKLKELYAAKNYGRWAVNGTVPVNFTADNHTSGGNSGSPVLNARGELIGTNFDRIWEGTMSDLYFDPNLCRNISVDIRYTLFIIEKFGNAGWLLKEMKLVGK